MSKNLPDIIVEPTTDFTEKDILVINEYIEDGLPNISSVDSAQLTRIFDLYLSGKTYTQISNMCRVKKSIILYFSQKFKWFETRKEYLADLESSIKARVMESRIVNQDFLLSLTLFYQKRIGSNINQYMATGNANFAEAIDQKEIERYLKIVDTLHKISSDPNRDPKALIGLNITDGATITRKGDNQIEISPKNQAIGDMLKQLADMKRDQEKVSK